MPAGPLLGLRGPHQGHRDDRRQTSVSSPLMEVSVLDPVWDFFSPLSLSFSHHALQAEMCCVEL